MIARISGFHYSFIRCLAAAVLVTSVSASAAVVDVSVVNNSFQPASVTIQVNDEVKWTWAPSAGFHTTTSGTPGLWDSGIHTQPFDFTVPFLSAGTFPYVCTLHAGIGMVGTVTVEGTSSLPPVITTQPANQTVNVGGTATFNVVATGTAPLSYQWRKDTSNIPGANAASLTLNAVTAGDAGSYTVVVTNTAGSVTSDAAVLTVNPGVEAPVITTQPASQTVTAGQPVTFNVVATGTAPLSYQWRKDTANIPGANAASLTLNAVTVGDAGSYTVVVTNTAGSVTSDAAILTVNPGAEAPVITTQPGSQTVTAGQPVTFTVVATGTAPLSYQWRKDTANIPGANAASLTLNAVIAADAGSYTVVVTNSAGSVTSDAAMLTVNPGAEAPVITTQPASQTVTAGTTGNLQRSRDRHRPLSYQWRKDTANIPGANAASLTLNAVISADAG
jgi:plastocyanin